MVINSSDLRCEAAQCALAEPTVPSQHLVLLMSDDSLMVRALTRLLRTAGYEVVVDDSSNGPLNTAESRRPALVIVDIPDGVSARAAESSFRAHRVAERAHILWIGDAANPLRHEDDHLVKPFTGSQFLSKVAALLNR